MATSATNPGSLPALPAGAGAPLALAKTLSGAQRAMLLLVSLDEDVATRVIAHLDEGDLGRLRAASESTQTVKPQAVVEAQRTFLVEAQHGGPTSLRGSDKYLERLVRNALGDGKAHALFGPPPPPPPVDGQEPAYRRLPPTLLASLLEKEHPQTIALVLSQLDSERGAALLSSLPTEIRSEVMMRVGYLAEVPEAILVEIDRELRVHLERLDSETRRKVDGKEAATAILKKMAQEDSQALLDELTQADAPMADKLQQALFTFQDLVRMDARGMQQLLKEVPTDQLLLALKTASEELKNKVLGNLSSRAADMLREDLALLGPTRISDVEAAQRQIVEAALALERDGRVTIARDGAGAYV